jgi:PAS domain S-box-containing protein
MSRNAFIRFLILFLAQAVAAAAVLLLVYAHLIRMELDLAKASGEQFLQSQASRISERVETVVSELIFLSTYHSLTDYLETGASAEYESIVSDLESFMIRHTTYDQIRFIDTSGSEVLRINYNDGNPSHVHMEDLQNKSHRYYFSEAVAVGYGEVYISPLDLNIEHGETEVPFKPMVRFATPVFDHSGTKRGIVMLNYLASDILDSIKNTGAHVPGTPVLLDPRGYWLLANSPDKEWGFMLGHDNTFQKEFPAAWKQISTRESGQFRNMEGIFTFRTIHPEAKGWVTHTSKIEPGTGRYYLKAVTMLTAAEIKSLTRPIRNRVLAVYAGLLMVMAAGSGMLAFFWLKRRNAEDALRSSEQRYRELTGLLPEIVFELDDKGDFTYINQIATTLTGYTQEDIEKGLNCLDTVIEDQRPLLDKGLRAILKGLHVGGHEYTMLRKDGSALPVIIKGSSVFDENGKICGIRGLVIDITKIKLAEEEIRRSLAEKEVLLMEIHHRVKNNLAIVSAFLSLQASATDDSHTRDLLTESQQRIHAMALVHDKLYQYKDLGTIDFDEYARDLASYLLRVHTRDEVPVKIKTDIADVHLSLDAMICCGLIMTELVTNAHKYAFEKTAAPEITVGLHECRDSLLCFSVRDNGCGLPEGLEIENTRSLGLRIVQSMVKQLEGSLEIKREGGTEFRVIFDPRAHDQE